MLVDKNKKTSKRGVMLNWKTHLKRAVDHAGGQSALAELIGRKQQYISFLLRDDEKGAKNIKADIAMLVEAATEGHVTKHDLRPDIFGEQAA